MTGIIDYSSGNIRSVVNALNRIGVESFVSGRVDELDRAERIILPGVGAARSAMTLLEKRGLCDWIVGLERPFLGICLGMQILFDHSDEDDTECLGIIPGTVHRFDDTEMKVPHMGWNSMQATADDPLFQGLNVDPYFYFVHGYHASRGDHEIGTTSYSVEFPSAVRFNNFYGVQFHPEKSGEDGLALLKNFCDS